MKIDYERVNKAKVKEDKLKMIRIKDSALHRELNILKAEMEFKTMEELLHYLLLCHKQEKDI